jgi:hypothetical protein
VLGVVLVALAAASPSQAMVTIGPDLNSLTPQPGGYNCNATHNCTLVNGSVGSGFGQPGLVSPVNGYITQIRVRTGPAGSGYFIFRQLRPVGDGYKGEITFGVVPNPPLPPNSTLEFPGFPIDAGDAIGIDCCQGGFDDITSTPVPGSGNFLVWGTGGNPLLGNGETRAPDSNHSGELLMLNADIVPENHFLLDEVRVKRNRVLATATVPNAGVLSVGNKLLRRTTVNAAAPDPGARATFSELVPLSVKTTKAGRARLRRAGKLKLRVDYTPIFGTPTSLKLTAKR